MLINHIAPNDQKAKVAMSADELTQNLKGKTPEEIQAYIQNNVTDFVEVQKFLYSILLYIQADSGG